MKLTIYPAAFGELSGSPFAAKAACLLEMSGLEYALDVNPDPRKAPKKKFPILLDGTEVIPDSDQIRDHLESKYGVDFDEGLSAQQRAVSRMVIRTFEENVYFAIMASRWMNDERWAVTKEVFFAGMPPVIGGFIANSVRKGVIKQCIAQGMGRHTEAEQVARVSKDVEALAVLLVSDPFMHGEKPTAVDASAVAMLRAPSIEVLDKAFAPAIRAMRRGTDDETTLPKLINSLTGGKACEKIVIVYPTISGFAMWPTKNDILYPRGSATVAHLMRLIGPENTQLFCALRNPANFLPSCYNLAYASNPDQTFQEFVSASNPLALRWSEYLHRVQGREADVPLNVWTFEDYPYIWRSVAQALTGLPNKEDLVAADVPLDQGMSLKGIGLMQEYLKKHPAETASRRNQVAQKFEERFPPVAREVIPDLWPEDLVEALSDRYDDDRYYIERMDNVRMIKRTNWS